MQNITVTISDALARWQGLWPDWLVSLAVLGAAAFLLVFVHALAMRVLQWAFRGRLSEFGRKLLRRIGPPTRLGLLVTGLGVVLQGLPERLPAYDLVERGLLFGFIIFLGWSAITIVNTASEIYLRRALRGSEDSVLSRKLLTQVRLLRRTVVLGLGFLTLSAMLMTIPSVRQYGVSLFASAGVAGLAIGLAARPVLSNLIAGVQLAITQPVRLGDEVLVEGEFGTVEEIQTTYVVIRLWDWRRLVVPLSYFMEKPFQNWTRQSSSILGSVFWYVDYATPIEAVRQKFHELLKESKHWDGQVGVLHVTDTQERSIQLRGLVSAASSGASSDLRNEIREKLITWLQETYPHALPRDRIEVGSLAKDLQTAMSTRH
ncbi:mechanosensitive ion channel family protein [Microvirga arsenatis]|uniref:Mechanosensitive ion channel n=1 Tax=Microvirga arsenatis TaxID=2692265 RepID=A0ABW9YRY5_9HYPH|nr:mechanosensitive ion channel domain-containing protein [Microvirga arsenatis]NBJ09969.1 mechanosensitive ion channel [Microvirga arsenatis]NBJ23037.1 mechanosensitive ion channel [Microvirga arsenatis]